MIQAQHLKVEFHVDSDAPELTDSEVLPYKEALAWAEKEDNCQLGCPDGFLKFFLEDGTEVVAVHHWRTYEVVGFLVAVAEQLERHA